MFGAFCGDECTVFIAFRIGSAMVLLVAAAGIADDGIAIIVAAADAFFYFCRQYVEHTFIGVIVGRFLCGTAS